MKKIKIAVEGISVVAELNESPTAQKIWDALPIEGSANTWGDEIYFEIPVTAKQAPDARSAADRCAASARKTSFATTASVKENSFALHNHRQTHRNHRGHETLCRGKDRKTPKVLQ